MKSRVKLIVLLGCVAVVLCGAAAAGITLAHRYQAPPGGSGADRRQSALTSATASPGGGSADTSGGGDAPSGATNPATGAANSSAKTDDSSAKSASKAPPSVAPVTPGVSGASGSANSGSSGSGNNSAKTSVPAPAPQPQPASVTITVDCRTVLSNMAQLKSGKTSVVPSNGVILGTRSVTLQEGDTVFSVLQRACKAAGVSLDAAFGNTYIRGIGNLNEFDCGQASGWVYSVNGKFLSVGCSKCSVKAGDSIALRYTCNGGPDVGAGSAR